MKLHRIPVPVALINDRFDIIRFDFRVTYFGLESQVKFESITYMYMSILIQSQKLLSRRKINVTRHEHSRMKFPNS